MCTCACHNATVVLRRCKATYVSSSDASQIYYGELNFMAVMLPVSAVAAAGVSASDRCARPTLLLADSVVVCRPRCQLLFCLLAPLHWPHWYELVLQRQHNAYLTRNWALDRVHSRSLGRIFAFFDNVTFRPNIHLWARYSNGLSLCQVWWFQFQPFWFYCAVIITRFRLWMNLNKNIYCITQLFICNSAFVTARRKRTFAGLKRRLWFRRRRHLLNSAGLRQCCELFNPLT